MANEKNLIPFNKRTPSERREISRKGAAASNEAQRRKKTLREGMAWLLAQPVKNAKDYNKAVSVGTPPQDIDNQQVLLIALFNRAKQGDVSAFKEIRDLVGDCEKESEGVKIIDDY